MNVEYQVMDIILLKSLIDVWKIFNVIIDEDISKWPKMSKGTSQENSETEKQTGSCLI